MVYITRWWYEKQTAVLHLNAWTEVHEWKGKAEHYAVSVVVIAPQVAGPLSSCPTGDGLSYDAHLKASICPNFPNWQTIGGGGVCVCVGLHPSVSGASAELWMGREGCFLTDTIAAVRWGVPFTPLHVYCTERRKREGRSCTAKKSARGQSDPS